MKQRQQKELADTLIAKVKKELENPKTLQSILQQSVQDVESMFFSFLLFSLPTPPPLFFAPLVVFTYWGLC